MTMRHVSEKTAASVKAALYGFLKEYISDYYATAVRR